MTVSRDPQPDTLPRALSTGVIVRDGVACGFWLLDRNSVLERDAPAGTATLRAVDVTATPHAGWSARGRSDRFETLVDALPFLQRRDETQGHAAHDGFLDAMARLSGTPCGAPGALPRTPFLFALRDAYGPLGIGRREIVELVGRQVADCRTAADAYLASLDAGALALCRLFATRPPLDPAPYRALDPAWSGDASLRLAVEGHPLLRNTLIAAWMEDGPATNAVLRERGAVATAIGYATSRNLVPMGVVDAIGHIDAAVGATGDEPADALRRAGAALGYERATGAIAFRDPPVALARALADLPRSWLPRDDAGWAALADVAGTVAITKPRCASPGDWAAMLNTKADWKGFSRRLRRAARTPDGDVADDVADIEHPVRALANQVLIPAMAIGAGYADDVAATPRQTQERLAVAGHILCSGRTLVRQVATSTSWHRADAAMRDAIASLDGTRRRGRGWAAAFPDHRMGTLTLRILLDEAELAKEGLDGIDPDGHPGLGHCVGGYGDRCRAGSLRIASVRVAMTGERLSTLALALGERGAFVAEHRGARNSPPPSAAMAFVDAYLDALSVGTIKVDPAGLAPVERSTTIKAVCGYDWSKPGTWEAVMALWTPHLPRAFRGHAPEDLEALARRPDLTRGRTWLPSPPAASATRHERRAGAIRPAMGNGAIA